MFQLLKPITWHCQLYSSWPHKRNFTQQCQHHISLYHKKTCWQWFTIQ